MAAAIATRRPVLKSLPYLAALAALAVFIVFPSAYHAGLFVIYPLANLYVYTRLQRLLAAGRRGRRVFAALYLLLFLAYPLVELLAHARQAGFLKYVLMFGYYSLPFLLYLFLLTAFGELLLQLGRLLKLVPPALLDNRKLTRAAFVVVLAGSAAIVVLGASHYRDIKVNEYAIEIPGRASGIDHMRIALAADFHIGDVTEPRLIATIIARINSSHPDIILLGGDLMEGDRPGFEVERFAALFRRLRAKYGVYAAPGNHEYHRAPDRADFFALAGITLLDDRFVVVDRAFCLAGRSDRQHGGKRPLAQVLRGVPTDLPLILMDHRPSRFAETLRLPVDIQLSAHTHHGQLFPIHWITALKYDLSWGMKRIGRTRFFVTCGVQTWGPPVRTVGDSEIMLIQVTFRHDQPPLKAGPASRAP
jgi:predicted MPP superfamily phosphohydrolase